MNNFSYSVTERYLRIPVRSYRVGPCPVCGKTARRVRTFEMTVNPLNKDPDTGLPRTRAQVLEAVMQRAAAWVPDPDVFTHNACRPDDL